MRLEEIKKWIENNIEKGYLKELGEHTIEYEVSNKYNSVFVMVKTKNNEYSIVAKSTYLGCIATCVKTGKGNDLTDGRFSEGTFLDIMRDIIEYEQS